MGQLTDTMTVKAYQHAFAQGYDHSYPNENIVRLAGVFFQDAKGKCLDYGYGFGENLLHLAGKGYEMYGLDVDETLVSRINKKISDRRIILDSVPRLTTIGDADEQLPYKDNFFDCVLSNQVVYLLADEQKIQFLLSEFRRVCRPGGRVLVTLMGEKNVCCEQGTYLGNGVYQYDDKSKMNRIDGDFTHRYYIVHSAPHIRYLFKDFDIEEIGYFDNNYLGIGGHHYVVMAKVPE